MSQTDLTAPVRLNYFPGMLLGTDDFETEQRYSAGRSQRHNRQLHGWGVVCGLDVTAEDDGVRVTPGLAIDGEGREIVVPAEQSVDVGDWTGKIVTLCLAYAEEPIGERFIRETFRFELRSEGKAPAARQLEVAATSGSADTVERAIHDRRAGCEKTGDCVALAEVDLTGKLPAIDTAVRRVLCDNGVLFALVLRLFDRVDALERERTC